MINYAKKIKELIWKEQSNILEATIIPLLANS